MVRPKLPRFLARDDKQNRHERHGPERAQRRGVRFRKSDEAEMTSIRDRHRAVAVAMRQPTVVRSGRPSLVLLGAGACNDLISFLIRS
jgi:hypothetical protein